MCIKKLGKLSVKTTQSAFSLWMALPVNAKKALLAMAGLLEQAVLKVKSQDQIKYVNFNHEVKILRKSCNIKMCLACIIFTSIATFLLGLCEQK